MDVTAKNVFMVVTPLQILNAIEAKNYFKLENNYLVVHLGGSYAPEKIKGMIVEHDWSGVYYFKLDHYPPSTFESTLLGPHISKDVRVYIDYYHKCLDRRKVDKIANALGSAKNLFLGDYMRSVYDCSYMRHFANTLKHDRLFLLDDGTSTIIINEERKNRLVKRPDVNSPGSYVSLLKRRIRDSLIEWNDKDADSITFFSAYDIKVLDNDYLIKNEYKHMRECAGRAVPSDEVYFLGEAMNESWMSEAAYLEYVNKVKNYFAYDKLIYFPHPREPMSRTKKINEELGIATKAINVPIEVEICIRGNRPKILAGFVSSALQNCRIILDDLKIMVFYISPGDLIDPTHIQSIYESFELNTSDLFTIVKI
jgi:hypothetical protein